jgi:hypothetical protein
MTETALKMNIDSAKKNYLHYQFTALPTMGDLHTIIEFCLSEAPDARIVDVYCNPAAKLFIMKKFWLDSFNYLGSRINVIVEDNMKDEVSTIPGTTAKYNYLLIADSISLCYAEMTE